MAIKLIVTDIDGTIVNTPHEMGVSREVKEAFDKAKRAGLSICLVSGRNYNSMLPIAEELGITESTYICCNGAVIRNEEDILYEKILNKKTLYYCRAFAKKFGLTAVYFSESELWMEVFEEAEESEFTSGELNSYKRCYIKGEEEFEQLVEKKISKVAYTGSEAEIDKAFLCWKTTIKSVPEELEVSKSFYNVFGVTAAGVNKGNAVAYLAKKHGISADEILAIGDNENDISMIRYAGIGAAVGNGTEELKELADVVVPGVEENGAAYAILNYAL